MTITHNIRCDRCYRTVALAPFNGLPFGWSSNDNGYSHECGTCRAERQGLTNTYYTTSGHGDTR